MRRKFGAKRRIAQGEFISPEHDKIRGPRRACPLGRGLGDAAQYLGRDAFFNIK